MDGAQRLMIKGRYTQKSMENVLRRYIGEYRARAKVGSWFGV